MSNYSHNDHAQLHPRHNDEAKDNGHRLQVTLNIRKKLIRHMLSLLDRKAGLEVLDAGCGNGLIYKQCIRPGLQDIRFALGIDFVQEVAESASSYFDQTRAGNVLELGRHVDRTFDLVNSTEVFLYIDPEAHRTFFKEHIAAIRPVGEGKGHGHFLLTVPNLDSVYRKIFKPEPELFPFHFNHQTIIELAAENAGELELVNACGVDVLGNIYNLDAAWKTFLSFELSFLFRRV